ncbi:MAG: TusE/DsrC/DsvC family sulfur relay protein [Pseudomonadota bacterium]
MAQGSAGAGAGAGDAAGRWQVTRALAGREIAFDNEGFFWDYADWSGEAARELAAEAGLAALGEAHWRVIRFLRQYYEHHGRAPLNQELKKGAGISLLELQGLFPGGLKHGARRLAGLPNPKTCN